MKGCPPWATRWPTLLMNSRTSGECGSGETTQFRWWANFWSNHPSQFLRRAYVNANFLADRDRDQISDVFVQILSLRFWYFSALSKS